MSSRWTSSPWPPRTKGAYRAQVSSYVSWLVASGPGPTALSDARVRDSAVREYKRHVKTARGWAPTSMNQALAAIDNFYRSLSRGRPEVPREDLPQLAPRALGEAEQRVWLRAVERCPSARDRVIATVFLYTALRLSELAALDLADVSMSARRGRLKVRLGKGDAYREVPLNSATRTALEEWLEARAAQVDRHQHAQDPKALWLARSGRRLSARDEAQGRAPSPLSAHDAPWALRRRADRTRKIPATKLAAPAVASATKRRFPQLRSLVPGPRSGGTPG